MGTTISNLQVLIRGMANAQETIEQALQALLTSQGYTVSDEEEAASRAYFAAIREGSEWASIFSHDLSGHVDVEYFSDLETLAVPLSEKLGKPVIHVELFDSAVMNLRLYEDGKHMDTISNWANYENMPKERSGDPEKWASILPPGATVDGLRMLIDPENPESKEKLQNTVDNTLDALLGAFFQDDGGMADMMRQQVKSFLPNDLMGMVSPEDAADLYQEIANLLEFDEELAHMSGDDFADIESTDDDDEADSDEDDLSISILYCKREHP